MSNVALTVGGRSYTVNCAAGEEDHIAELGRMIDGKLTAMGATGQNETRNLLFAALLLADEVYELNAGGAVAPSGNGSAAGPHADSLTSGHSLASEGFAIDPERLENIARRLENLASHLEG